MQIPPQAGGEGSSSPGLAQPGGAGVVDRDELRDAALGHRDAEEAIDPRHRDAMMRHHQDTAAVGVGDLADGLQKRSTLASSSGASTSSSTQTGAGFFGKSAIAKTDRNIPDAPTR